MEIRFLADVSLNGAIVSGCKRREPATDIDELVHIWAASDMEEWADRILRIPLP